MSRRPAPAFRIDGNLVERDAFYAAACDPMRSCVVEACAGSGKTWMLVSRMLRALLEGAAPHEILAITFTRAAAGEMRERLDLWLGQFARCDHAARVRELRLRGLDAARAEALAPELGRLQERVLAAGRTVEIRTFHGWFAQLLRSAPLVLLDSHGLQPDVELVEDWADHRPAVFRAFHAAVIASPSLRADHQAQTAKRGRFQLLAWLGVAWDKRIEFELADAAGTLATSVETAAAMWPGLAVGRHPHELLATDLWRGRLSHLAGELARMGKTAAKAAQGLHAALACDDLGERFGLAWNALFTLAGEPRVLGRGAAVVLEAQEALARLGDQIDQHEAHEEHQRMTRLGRALLAALAEYKRANGLADMADLERVALALLRDSALSGWVQERLDARISHLLIDEFQDTSPLQWHALHGWLAGYAGAGGGASGQRPPGVFIVGDPKQSIYRFRRAEPRVFEAAAGFVRDGLGGRVLTCDHTRRNAPRVIAAINAAFLPAAADGSFAGFRAHTTEVVDDSGSGVHALARTPRPPRASAAAIAAAPWRDSLTVARREVEEVLREREADAVATAIRGLVDAGTAPARIFVLCRKRESLRHVAPALARVHVAHSAVEDTALAETTEAQDLIALLDFLVSPGHRLSLARALRSPLFGIGDADLLVLAEAAVEHRDWWQALRELATPSPALERARRLLMAWQADAAALPPHDLLDRIVDQGDVRARVAATVPAERRAQALDAVDALLAQALFLDAGRYATPYGFVRALRRRSIKATLPVRADAVRLLTIHGAKGLEADCVFVMDTDPERQNPETTTLLVEWPVEAEAPRRCAFLYSEGRCPPSLREALAAEQGARQREELNGLYVAMSRCKQRLVFSATEPFIPPPTTTWWQRVGGEALGPPPASTPDLFTALPALADDGSVVVRELPSWRRQSVVRPGVAAPTTAPGFDAGAAPLGRALHRVLEWAGRAGARPVAELVEAAARDFGVDAGAVRRPVEAILADPEGRRFFVGTHLLWSGNEVPVSDGGEVLRIDRLVRLRDGADAVWWVLDYKLRHAPGELEPYRQQLLRYRTVVARAQPGEPVRAAFLTGEGRVVEVVEAASDDVPTIDIHSR